MTDNMLWLAAQLAEQFAESARLESEIRKHLAGLGYVLNTGAHHD